MEELGSAPPAELLMLAVIALIAAVMLAGLLIFFFMRRQRKKAESSGPVVLTDRIATARPPTPAPSRQVAPEATTFSQEANTEALTMETRQQPAKIDLTSRLGSQPPAAAPPAEPAELLRLLRQPETGQLVVEVAGRRYTKLADVSDKQVGQYILKLVAHLLAFTNGMIVTESGVKSVYLPRVKQTPQPLAAPPAQPAAPRPAPVMTPTPPAAPAPLQAPPPEVEAAFLASLRSQPLQPEPKPPRSGGGGLFGGRPKPKNEPAPLVTFNLADEINKIVQARLLASPLAATTQLEILSDAGGGIKIDVNGRIYASPDDIPDPQVKALIKESIKQWERS